nr:MAG TPA: Protein FAM3C protein.8A [Caudoviricetes sp.]
MNGIKISYRTEFPLIDRMLFAEGENGKALTVRVINGSTGQLVSSEHFEDYNEALKYYRELIINLKRAETHEAIFNMFKMLGFMDEE